MPELAGNLLMKYSEKRADTAEMMKNKMMAFQFGQNLATKEAKRKEAVQKDAQELAYAFEAAKTGIGGEEVIELVRQKTKINFPSRNDLNELSKKLEAIDSDKKRAPEMKAKLRKAALDEAMAKYGMIPAFKEEIERKRRESAVEGGTPAMKREQYLEGGKVAKEGKGFAPKELIYQNKEGEYRAGLFNSQGGLVKDLRKATEKEIKGKAGGAGAGKESPEQKRALGFVNQLFDFAEINAKEKADLMNRISKSDKPLDIINRLFDVAKKQNRKGLFSRIKEWLAGEKEPSPVVVTDSDVDDFITRNKLADTPTNREKIREKLREAK